MNAAGKPRQNYYRNLLTTNPHFFCDEAHKTWGIDFSVDDALEKIEVKGRSSSNLFDLKNREHFIRIEDLSREEHTRFSCSVLMALHDARCYIVPELVSGNTGCLKVFRENGGASMSVFKFKNGYTLELWKSPSKHQTDLIIENYILMNDALSRLGLPLDIDKFGLNNQISTCIDDLTQTDCWMDRHPLAMELNRHWHTFCEKTDSIMKMSEKLLNGKNNQIIHGDIHQENILFDCVKDEDGTVDERFVSFLDFEEVAVAPVEVDVIFTALRMAKTDKKNPRFAFDMDAVDYFLKRYGESVYNIYADDREFWHSYFGLQQSVVYLRHHDVWSLSRENGFFQCFNEVLNYNV